jgi:RNA polymerase sigma-70 factor, ECF subfamily
MKPLAAELETEKEIVRRAQQGDREAFASLYERHKQKVFALCLRITRNREEAEDCTQEAFMQCFLRLSTFRGESALSTWLYRLTVNTVLMRMRGQRRMPIPVEASVEDGASGSLSLLNAFPVVDLHLTGAIDRLTLRRALNKLPRGYRTIFLMHEVAGMAHSEIARQLGCSVGTSKSQLHQARARLRRFLGKPLRAPVAAPPSNQVWDQAAVGAA